MVDSLVELLVLPKDVMKAGQLVESKVETMAVMLADERVTWMDEMKGAWSDDGMDDSLVALLVLQMDEMMADQLVESKVETMAAMWVEERVVWMGGMKVAW